MTEREIVLVAVHLTVLTGGFEAWCIEHGHTWPGVAEVAGAGGVHQQENSVAQERMRLVDLYVRERLVEFFSAEVKAEIVQQVEEMAA